MQKELATLFEQRGSFEKEVVNSNESLAEGLRLQKEQSLTFERELAETLSKHLSAERLAFASALENATQRLKIV